jgi:hypothetical protein
MAKTKPEILDEPELKPEPELSPELAEIYLGQPRKNVPRKWRC